MSMKFTKTAAIVLAALFTTTSVAAFAADVPANIESAVKDSARPASDTERDVHRKPAELVAFAGIKAGDKVAEISPGKGYYTRILSKVVGPEGKVYVVNARNFTELPADKNYGNIVVDEAPLAQFATPEPVDVVWTTENFHDFHNPRAKLDMKAVDKAIFDALKPGGVFILTDHAAAAGHGADDVATLHRIDPEFVKKEVESVGFKLEDQSNMLANAKDDHTQPVFKLHDQTDIFVFKFRKPAN
jgi:predicted methyltransferase